MDMIVVYYTNSKTELKQVFSWGIFNIFKNTDFEELLLTTVRSRPEVFCEKGVLRNFAKFTGKYLRQSLFFNRVENLWHRCFPVKICEISKNTFLQNTSGGCFLTVSEKKNDYVVYKTK